MNVSALAVFVGGILTIFAPCAAMLLPSFFAYAFASRRTLGARTAVFALGLIVAFVPIGAFAGTLGAGLRQHSQVITTVAGLIIASLGVAQIFAFSLSTPNLGGKLMSRPLQNRPAESRAERNDEENHRSNLADHPDAQPIATRSQEPSALAVFLLGVGYAIAGIGCSGPILGAVLATSLISGSAFNGFIHALLFALGMATPVVILAFIWDALKVNQRAWLRPRPIQIGSRTTTVMNVVSGGIFVVLGLALVFLNGFASLPSLLSVEQQISLETQISSLTATVPTFITLSLIVVLIGLAVVIWRTRNSRDQ